MIRPIIPPLLGLLVAGCTTMPNLGPAGRYVPCTALGKVIVNEEAIPPLAEEPTFQIHGNNEAIREFCTRTKQ